MPAGLGWGAHLVEYDGLDNRVHVVPIDDLKDHSFDVVDVAGEWRSDCWCGAWIEEECGGFVHNSLDQRERYEQAERRPA